MSPDLMDRLSCQPAQKRIYLSFVISRVLPQVPEELLLLRVPKASSGFQSPRIESLSSTLHTHHNQPDSLLPTIVSDQSLPTNTLKRSHEGRTPTQGLMPAAQVILREVRTKDSGRKQHHSRLNTSVAWKWPEDRGDNGKKRHQN
jgi:hypothetical protein